MKLSLFVDIYNRKLVKSATSDFPVDLPTLFREDWIDLEITLVEPSGTITSPQTVVDVRASASRRQSARLRAHALIQPRACGLLGA